jgi:sortase A
VRQPDSQNPIRRRAPAGRRAAGDVVIAAHTNGNAEDGPVELEASPTEDSAGEPSEVAAGTKVRRRRRPGSIAFTAAVITAGMGLLVAAFAAYLFGFTSVEAFHTQHHLAEQLAGTAGLAALNGKTPAEGQAVAIIDIPSLGIRQIVVEGTTSQDLESGPGLLIGSAPPGTGGDVVIAGRRTTYGSPFAHLDELQVGDSVMVTGALGQFRYTISGVRVVSPGSPLPAGPTQAARLTLVTSTPAVRASALLIVTADLVAKPIASVPLSHAALPPAEFGLAGDGSALTPAILWGAGLIAVLLFAWYLLRRTRKTWLIYGLATPVVIAIAILCFANVAALLPATL